MSADLQQTREVVLQDTLHPRRVRWLDRLDLIALPVGIASTLMDHAIRESEHFQRPWEFGALSFLAMATLVISIALRHRWSLAKRSLMRPCDRGTVAGRPAGDRDLRSGAAGLEVGCNDPLGWICQSF